MLYGIARIHFFSFFLFFSATILSGPYLWNRYSQRLQIECAAWSCGLIVHCCLPSTSLRYFFLFFIFLFFSAKILSGPYLWNHYSQRLQIECAAWSWGLILHCCLPSNSLCYFFFFSATILSGPYLWNRYSQRLQIECAAWSCGLIVHYCLPSNSLRYFFFFRHDFVRAISLEPLLAETPNWVCCLVLWSNCALLLTIQFASLVFFPFFPPRFCPGHISGTVTRRDSKLSVVLGPAV